MGRRFLFDCVRRLRCVLSRDAYWRFLGATRPLESGRSTRLPLRYVWAPLRGPRVNRKSAVRGRLMCACVVVVGALCGSGADALGATTTVRFDPPDYEEDERVFSVPGAALSRVGIVDARPETASPPNALRPLDPCDPESGCGNLANRLDLTLTKRVNGVSMAVGAWNVANDCFPEGTTCPVWARLIGFDEDGGAVADSGDIQVADLLSPSVTERVAISDPLSRVVSATLSLNEGLVDPLHEATGPRNTRSTIFRSRSTTLRRIRRLTRGRWRGR